MKIILPTKKGDPNTTPEIDFKQLVVIGANGSGKTRFGSDIERRYIDVTHRISAQKSLSMPEFVGTKSKEAAEKDFFYGTWQGSIDYIKNHGKFNNRWTGNLNTSLLNDYEKLMTLLHTEEFEQSLAYKDEGIIKPNTKLDKVKKIWETVLPHRKLLKKAGVIETHPIYQEEAKYNASQMSDGERVVFYLIGEVVCAPKNSTIIIDEPEMHLHKSLVKNLFDLIEIEREDCTFIYLTHDIDFAFTRQNATKIWAKSYEGNDIWDYELLSNESPIPEQLYFEVLGSRKPILFLEGEDNSIDYQLYQQVYRDYTIKAIGSCEKVIQIVKAFNNYRDFHQINSFGIIDRDTKQDKDVSNLTSKHIWVLDVAEAENLLLLEDVIKMTAVYLGKDKEDIFSRVKENLIAFFNTHKETQILFHLKEILRRRFLEITNFTSKNISDTISEIDNSYSAIDKKQVYDELNLEFEKVIRGKDYDGVLRLFNSKKKGLIANSKVCDLIGIKSEKDYLLLIITILKGNNEMSKVIKEEIKRKIITST